jgi:DNA primase
METAYIATALLLRAPNLLEVFEQKTPIAKEIAAPGIELFNSLVNILKQTPSLLTDQLREKLQQNGFELNRLIECEKKVAFVPEEGLEAEFCGAIARLEVVGREQYAEKLLIKAKNTELTDEEKAELKEFLQSRESIG